MSETELNALRRAVERNYPSIHAFCKSHTQLSRTAVYLVFAGKYPGNVDAQAKRIRAALDNCNETQRIFTEIKRVACSRCSVSGACNRCDSLFQEQAEAVQKVFSS